MKEQETVKEFVYRALKEAKTDIDVEFCLEHNIKYDNHEIDAQSIELFDTKTNKEAFDFVLGVGY